MPSLHVPLEHGRHGLEFLACEEHIAGQALMLRIDERVTSNAPQRLLELGRREKEPAVDLGSLLEVGRDQASFGELLGQIERDGHRLGEHHVAVDERGEFAGRIDLEEFGAAVLAGGQIHGDRLEVDAQLLERPANPDRSGRAEFV